MEMVKKLQKAGSLEPRVEVLINRINEVQQAKKKASEELGEARTVWEALQKELDSLSEEKVHLKGILSKKQETLMTLRLHCQEKDAEAQRKQAMLQECKERISILNSQIEEEKNRQRKLRLDFEEQLEELMSQHKDLWEFHRPEHLAQEIGALDSSKEQLLKEVSDPFPRPRVPEGCQAPLLTGAPSLGDTGHSPQQEQRHDRGRNRNFRTKEG
ncbi:synaptonemal complex central element protein 1 [Pteropus vampyrus]|uniref:Synaptonemal complex central element protein 1 n=1 Tax=Pteropus vampyrus TaxID=132908 RepID=A0A6P3RAK7_PTEVA|nr:synaptonemal complex central element protein 1 [Pteropus vampyrus]